MVRNLINRADDLLNRPDDLINRAHDLLNRANRADDLLSWLPRKQVNKYSLLV